VKKLLTCLALLLACSTASAQDEDQPFLEIAKGNSWKYDVVDHGNKSSGKLAVEDVGNDGRMKVTAEDLGAGFPEEMTWEVSGGFLVWRLGPEFEWKVFKLNASKDDAWSGKPSAASKLVLKSRVAAVEKVTVPAGSFDCLKVETTSEGEENPPVTHMWWAKGVGLVKAETIEFGRTQTTWALSAFTVGCHPGSEALKELLDKADVVAQITVPKEGAGATRVKVKLACSFKGEPKAEDGQITVSFPEGTGNLKPLDKGEFVVFLKKQGDGFALMHEALPADKLLLDRLMKLVTPREQTVEKLRSLCAKAEIVAGIEIVKLEDRVDFKYHVAKIIGAAKGAGGREHVDIGCVAGLSLETGKKYIMFLSRTTVQGRGLLTPVDADAGVLAYDEGLLGKLKEICEGAGK
jgi:hypothetical protein